MGGYIVRNEPATTALLEHYPAVYEIFQQAGASITSADFKDITNNKSYSPLEIFRRTILSLKG
jgi:hypothetical protein